MDIKGSTIIILIIAGLIACAFIPRIDKYDLKCEVEKPEPWKITYYCSCQKCCGRWADGHFASGRKVYAGGIACNWLPFGTKLKIGEKIYTVEDRGAERYFGSKNDHVKHIDIWLPSHEQALQAGVDWSQVEVVDGDK